MCSETTGVHIESVRKSIAIEFDDKCFRNTFSEKSSIYIYDLVTLKQNLSMLKLLLFFRNINDYYGKGCFQTSIFCVKSLQRP